MEAQRVRDEILRILTNSKEMPGPDALPKKKTQRKKKGVIVEKTEEDGVVQENQIVCEKIDKIECSGGRQVNNFEGGNIHVGLITCTNGTQVNTFYAQNKPNSTTRIGGIRVEGTGKASFNF